VCFSDLRVLLSQKAFFPHPLAGFRSPHVVFSRWSWAAHFSFFLVRLLLAFVFCSAGVPLRGNGPFSPLVVFERIFVPEAVWPLSAIVCFVDRGGVRCFVFCLVCPWGVVPFVFFFVTTPVSCRLFGDFFFDLGIGVN